jgi:hypothetical protein
MTRGNAPNTPGDYPQMLGRMRAALTDTNAADRDWILGESALQVYSQLEESHSDARVSVTKR